MLSDVLVLVLKIKKSDLKLIIKEKKYFPVLKIVVKLILDFVYFSVTLSFDCMMMTGFANEKIASQF